MKVTVLAVGRVKGPLSAPVQEFEHRAGRYWRLDIVEVEAGGPKGGDKSPEAVCAAESERLSRRIPAGTDIVALTRRGKAVSSTEFARYLEELGVRSSPGVTFVLGGAFGLGADLLAKASRKLALSPMTMPHEMARLVLAEQLYRAGTILKNEPYHKGSAT
ncbi:MAG: 23S rRNA (pseudouridine(1915)-N(3))-methyltransferase RlmH [Gemmatimonadota bacterium]|nr:MAG: 23S rRNA (pseudouridine(1915)-N(3))-methyltransferase RlmH [Gemmatimonadota bacterium]